MNLKKKSKFLALVLRHNPGKIGLTLSDDGWASVDELIEKAGTGWTLEVLSEIVETDDKSRYVFSDDGRSIRAQQGHSIAIVLDYEAVEPPHVLFHGTPDRFVVAIRKEGLSKMARHHVHLSEDIETASVVGNRRGKAHIFSIDASKMSADGHLFYVTPNGVWLVEHVPAQYLS